MKLLVLLTHEEGELQDALQLLEHTGPLLEECLSISTTEKCWLPAWFICYKHNLRWGNCTLRNTFSWHRDSVPWTRSATWQQYVSGSEHKRFEKACLFRKMVKAMIKWKHHQFWMSIRSMERCHLPAWLSSVMWNAHSLKGVSGTLTAFSLHSSLFRNIHCSHSDFACGTQTFARFLHL